MKYIKLFISIIILIIFLSIGFYIIKRKPEKNVLVNVAFIDTDEITNKSLVLQDIQHQVKEQSSKLQQEFEDELEKFKLSKEEFELLSEEAKKEKMEQLDEHTLNSRNNYTKKMLYLEKNYKDAMGNIFNKIKKISKEIAKKNDIDLILLISKKNQVLYFINDSDLDKIDLSGIVLENINKEIQKYTLEDIN
ncbi:MAG: OmpH family outer membrane protein [Wolbachia endosymbiont of Menacanthus eurysternus]|nr:MAG: OmpH family outer membrane protein [Wolbachia endosymbiont of Menacanthus eurysternus]